MFFKMAKFLELPNQIHCEKRLNILILENLVKDLNLNNYSKAFKALVLEKLDLQKKTFK